MRAGEDAGDGSLRVRLSGEENRREKKGRERRERKMGVVYFRF